MKCQFICVEKNETLFQASPESFTPVHIVKMIPVAGEPVFEGVPPQGGFQLVLTDQKAIASLLVGQKYILSVTPVVDASTKPQIIVPVLQAVRKQ